MEIFSCEFEVYVHGFPVNLVTFYKFCIWLQLNPLIIQIPFIIQRHAIYCLLQRQFLFDSICSQSTLRCRKLIERTIQTQGYTNVSKPSINYICHPFMNKISPFFRTRCIYLFSVIFKINTDYFPPQNSPVFVMELECVFCDVCLKF